MSDKRIPGVPTIGNIQDPEVRKALQALSDGWRVRNGETKDVGSQFVTRDDLERYLQSGSWQGGSGVGGGAQLATGQMARGGIGQAFRGLVQSIIAEIQSSVLWQRLSSRIDALDGPNGVLHRIGLTESGIKRFESQTNNKIEVIEGILIQPDGETLAAVVEERIAEIADGLARTLSQTTLQTMVNGGSVLAQEALQINQSNSVEKKLDVSWTVKFDLDGYVVGAGLGLEGKDGTYTSQFLVRADRFAVGSPTAPNVFPFIVDNRPGGAVIALNGQVYIGAATAEQIAENSSVPAVNSIGAFASPPSTTGLKKNSVYRNTTDGNVYILTTDGGSWSLWIEKGAPGQPGTPGTPGPSGTRGSMTLYASGSSWSDTTANNAITNATGSSTRVIGDTVTISNGSSFAATRYWSGSSWLNPGVVIDGNLLVTGTLSANKITAGTLSADRVSGGVLAGSTIRIASSAGGWLFEAGNNGTVVAYRQLSGYNIYAGSLSSPGSPAVTGAAMGSGVGVHGFCFSDAQPTSHGVRGSRASGQSGLVGAANNYDFYAEGTGTNYGPFTGAHDCLVSKQEHPDSGDILVDVACVARNGLSNTLHTVTRSSSAYQKNPVGIYLGNAVESIDEFLPMGIRDDWDAYCNYRLGYNYALMNAIGEGQINVCGEGGDLEIGDLIVTSSLPGKGMKQADDIVRNYTVAKCREHVTFSGPTDVKQVACIYLCG